MKLLFALLLSALLLSIPPFAVAQAPVPAATVSAAPVLPNGVTVFNGVPYWIWNGRISAVDNTLIPIGQILTPEGRLAQLPPNIVFPAPAAGQPPATSRLTPPQIIEPTPDAAPVRRGTEQNTVRGVVPQSTVSPGGVRGTDQQVVTGTTGTKSGTNVTGTGGLRRE